MAPRYVLGLTIKATLVVNEIKLNSLTHDSMTKYGNVDDNSNSTAIHHGSMVGGVMFALTIYWFAWTAGYNSVHWAVPTVAGCFLATSILLIFVVFVNYIVDAYLKYAASAIAANTILRSACAAAPPLFTQYMFDALGVGGPGSLVGGIGILLMPIPFICYKYGATFRSRLKPSDLASDIQRFLATGFTAITAGSTHSVGSLFPQIPHPAVPPAEIPFMPQPLTRDERKKYLCIFWNSCHPQLNIVSEAESVDLEATPQAFVLDDYSVQNALLDACLAQGIQHSHATGLDKRLSGSRHIIGAGTKEYVGWPGFEHFHCCRERMRTNAEVILQALQRHALMVLSLLRGYAFRDAYNMLGITVRKAYAPNYIGLL